MADHLVSLKTQGRRVKLSVRVGIGSSTSSSNRSKPGMPMPASIPMRRAGTASIFMFCEPLAGWRQVSVREQRTKIDWALEMAELLRGRYAAAEKVILVCDTLNTHTIGAFYEAFDPATAWSLIRRLEFRHTPKHDSWLNIAENELSALIGELREETAAWHEYTNEKQRGVDWQLRIDDARTKLKSLYPKTKG